MLGGIGGRRRRGWERMRWLDGITDLTWWTWLWVNSGSWWWIGRPSVLRFMASQSQTWLSDWTELKEFSFFKRLFWRGLLLKPSLNLLQYCFCSMVWFLCREGCGISAPQPGMEPITPALEAEVLTTISPRKPPEFSFSKMRGVLEKDGGDGCTEMGMSLTWLNSTPQNSQDGKFYVRCCCCCEVAPVMFGSARPHGRQPTRLPRPWDSPGKNTGVGCHCLLQCRKVKRESEVAQLCPGLCDPIDSSPPGKILEWENPPGFFQARVLEWGTIAFSKCYMHFTTNFKKMYLKRGVECMCKECCKGFGFKVHIGPPWPGREGGGEVSLSEELGE